MDLRRWLYTFGLHTLNLGDQVYLVKNPFTGEPREVPIDPGLTEAEWQAIQQVFREQGFDGPLPEGEGYVLFMPDAECLGLRGGRTGFVVEVTILELTNPVLNILLDIARAGNLAFTSTTGDHVRLLDGAHNSRSLARWPDAKVFHSLGDLKEWLVNVVRGREVIVPTADSARR